MLSLCIFIEIVKIFTIVGTVDLIDRLFNTIDIT